MKPAKAYLFGFRMMVVIIVIRLVQLVIYWIYLQRLIRMSGQEINPARVIGWGSFISTIVIIVEATVYWYRRYKIPDKTWVRIHVWSLFVAMVLIPVAMGIMTPALARTYTREEYYIVMSNMYATRDYVYWSLLALGHLFFIITIVRSFQLKESQSNEPPGVLDEFVNRS